MLRPPNDRDFDIKTAGLKLPGGAVGEKTTSSHIVLLVAGGLKAIGV